MLESFVEGRGGSEAIVVMKTQVMIRSFMIIVVSQDDDLDIMKDILGKGNLAMAQRRLINLSRALYHVRSSHPRFLLMVFERWLC